MLILEGMRGSGKTTACLKILEKFKSAGVDAEIFKGTRIEGVSPNEGMLATIKEMDSNPLKVYILDRFHLTEYVMSSYLQRRDSVELLIQTKKLDLMLRDRSAKCVIFDATYDTIDLRMAERDGTRKLDMPVLNAKNLWAESKALSTIAVMRINNTSLDQIENVEYCFQSVMNEFRPFIKETSL